MGNLKIIGDKEIISREGIEYKLSTNLSENIQTGKGIINSIIQNPENIPAIKTKYSEQISQISKKAGIGEGVKNVIQLHTLLNQSPDGNSFLSKNKDFIDSELFDYNNPIILIGMIGGLAKQNIKQSYKIDIFGEYLSQATEENIYELLKNLENIDKQGLVFNLFVKELVLFTIRYLQANITIKENKKAKLEISENFYHKNETIEFDYGQNLEFPGDFVDLEGFENRYDYIEGENSFDSEDIISEMSTFGDDGLNNLELKDIFEGIENDTPLFILLTVVKENYQELFNQIILDLNNFTERPIYGYASKDIQKNIIGKASIELFNLLKYLIGDKEIESVKKQVIEELFKSGDFTSEAKEKVIYLLEHEGEINDENLDYNSIEL